ncbi:MAG: sulfolactate dehydrogenase [Burkholderiales bacterium]|nr:sulfolactate dehydrogenase [Burkholderiales bacterium]
MKVMPAQLEEVAAAALRAAGASAAMAAATARCLVEADMRGLVTHGLARVPTYCAHLKSGRAVGSAEPVIARDKKAACLIDAGNGLAFLACVRAVDEAKRRAKQHGAAVAGVTNSHHCGALGILLEPLAAGGMVGIAFSNAPAAITAWGGKRPVLGTNPVAAIFPRAAAEPVVIDMSLTQVTRGQIMLLANAGKPIPEGWGMDAEGRPTTDPQKILVGGSLHAVGGLKGTMLALAVELLCCALTGAALSSEMESLHLSAGAPMRFGQMFVAIDPDALAGGAVYAERIETLITAMLTDDAVRLPGMRRADARTLAMRAGIELDEALYRELETLAARSTV